MSSNKEQQVVIEKALEHRILHGLSLEWEMALWDVGAQIRNQLSKPLFGLRDMDRRLGAWFPDKREISLSRQFVRNSPWVAVRNVLHHEMAHQIADEIFEGHQETAHGPSFHRACRALRIDPTATGAYGSLHDATRAGQMDPEDRILVRIRKLLALAKSHNSHEADAAMLKAHELLAKYHVDLLVLEQKRSFISRLVTSPALRHSREKYLLASLLQEYYFVQGIWVPAYVVEKGKTGRALEISGTAQDVDLASYVYDFVINYISSQWAAYNRGSRRRHHRKIDFAVGIVEGFKRKLNAQKERLVRTEASYALIEQRDPQLAQYMAYKYPRTARVSHKAILQDPDVLSDGIEIGKKLVISKGITEKKHGRELLPMP